MIYIVVPIWAEWDDIRVFTTYAAMEAEVLKTATYRNQRGAEADWCFVMAFDGADEHKLVWKYYINKRSMRLDRVTP